MIKCSRCSAFVHDVILVHDTDNDVIEDVCETCEDLENDLYELYKEFGKF